MERIQTVYRCIVPVSLALLAVSIFTGCDKEPEAIIDPIVVQVGERAVHLSELQVQLDYWEASGSALPADKERFIERYIERVVALEKAYELGLDQEPELRSQWESLLIGRLRSMQFEAAMSEVSVSPDEVEAYYDMNRSEYTRPQQVRIALLFLSVDLFASDGMRPVVNAKLETARQMAADLPEGTQGFGALAMKYSEDGATRFKGGDAGWLEAGRDRYRWPNEVVSAAFDLQNEGAISDVIDTAEGSYLIMLLDGRDEVIRPLNDSLISQIEGRLLSEKQQSMKASIVAGWSHNFPIEINTTALSKLNFATAKQSPLAAPSEYSSIPNSN